MWQPKSIQFHDPSNQWNKLQQNISLRSDFVYPDSALNGLIIGLDNLNKKVNYTNVTLAQQVEFTDSTCLVIEGDKTCEQIAWTKNFYHFILGLPMTLINEEGIIDDFVVETSFYDTLSYRVRVDFEKEKWHFYFSQFDYRLIGFAFNKNFESKSEEVKIGGLEKVGEMKLPKIRSWWITTDSLAPIYSGTDEIKGSTKWLKNEEA